MKQSLLFVGLLFSVSACSAGMGESDVIATDDEAEVSTTASELGTRLPNNVPFLDELGLSSTWSAAGNVDLRNDFFKQFGTNGRSCGSCHTAADGWTVSAKAVRLRFALTGGLDPIFRPVDGANSPDADVSSVTARRAAYSMLLSHGTIRVGLPVPENAEFELIAVDDPYGHASATELSLFRRPLPAANLTLMATVMWDGRVTGATITDALSAQADGATLGHAQALAPLPPAVNANVVAFESALSNAQLLTWGLGRTDAAGATGGAKNLASQDFVADRFNLFDAWQDDPSAKRQGVYRGQELFNTRRRTTGGGACGGCHSAQNIGTSQRGAFFDIGVASAEERTPDMPLYTFRNKTTSETLQTTDPGRALITGVWKDMKKFKTPSMRGLAARAPYFHDGSASTLLDVVRFYETSLSFDFTADEESDLVAFLSAL